LSNYNNRDVHLIEFTPPMTTPTPKFDDLIYDVGMHKGEDSEFYLRKGFRVIAFEANSELIESCKRRLRSYIDDGKLTIVEGAVVGPDAFEDCGGTVKFYKNSDLSVWGTVREDWADRNARMGTSSIVTEVTAIDFTDAVRTYGVPYFMKIDIEGCDTVCVNALREFEHRPTYISIESDKTSIENIRREIELFQELGYTSFQAVEQSAIPTCQHPPNPPKEGHYVDHCFAEGSSGLFGRELEPLWRSKDEVLSYYRAILLGFRLLGDDGMMTRWRFRGADRIRTLTERAVGQLTHAAVPGWFDTHARHASCEAEN
jgi:FkbM family methyltransferase